jgi:hypothetical protein
MDKLYEGRMEVVRNRFLQIFRSIDKSRWISLPELLAKSVPKVWAQTSIRIAFLLRHHYNFLWALRWIQPILLALTSFFLWNWWLALLIALASICISSLHYTLERASFLVQGRFKGFVAVLVILADVLAVPIVILLLIPRLNTFERALVLILTAPYYCIGIGLIVSQLIFTPIRIAAGKVKSWSERTEYNLITFASVITFASFAITYLAISLGTATHPDQPMPRSIQVLGANLICDMLTVISTFFLLRWATKRSPFIRIPIAVLIDLLFAAILACASLYFALVGTHYSLDPVETLNVLIARSPNSQSIALGSYFWVMHTSFLPTAGFLFLIVFAWTGKFFMTVLRSYFGVSKIHPHPYRLAGTLFAVFTAIFFSFYLLSGHFAKRQELNKEHVSNVYTFDKKSITRAFR